MENLNIPPFVQGDKVVYIGRDEHFIKKGSIHIVSRCGKQDCGCWFVDTNNLKHITISLQGQCAECGNVMKTAQGICRIGLQTAWLYSGEFRKVQEQKMKQVSFEKLLEECPVGVN